MKKVFSLVLLVLIGFSLTACTKNIKLTIDTTDITIIEGDEYTIIFSTNDTKTPEFVSSDDSIITVDDLGIATAVSEGEATITVTSDGDSSIVIELSFSIRKLITMSSNESSIELTEEDTHLVGIDSNESYTFSSSNTDLFVVDEDGLITAKKEGSANLVVTSTYDPMYKLIINIHILKLSVILPEGLVYDMVIGDSKLLNVTSNDTYTFESRNPNIAKIDDLGNIEAIGFGEATIRITSETDSEVIIDVIVNVFKYTHDIVIEGTEVLVVGMIDQLVINPSPLGSYPGVIWESNNTDVVTIDENGYITGIGFGTATIIAKSSLDETIADTYEVEVINVIAVDSNALSGDTYDYNGTLLQYGDKLFTDISSALSHSTVGTLILIEEGTYNEDLVLNIDNLAIEGINNVIIEGSINISANNSSIKNINFIGSSSIINTGDIDNLLFSGNNVENINLPDGSFLDLIGVSNIYIQDNLFSNINVNAVTINDFVSGMFLIKDNTFVNLLDAITIDADREYDITTEINIIRNNVSTVTTGITIDLLYGSQQKQIEAYARFNVVTNYTFGAKSNIGNQVDFTLNYWGSEIMDYTKFVNIEQVMLRGFYTLETDIISEDSYNPLLPVRIEITNPISEITIGDLYTILYDVLPMDIDDSLIKYITSNPTVLAINQDGELTPLTSGESTITVRSSINSSIKTSIIITVITLPGIELAPSNVLNNNIVGSTFTLNATPFPITIIDEDVSFVSSNIEVATIDEFGVVNTTGVGNVTFTAILQSDPSVTQTFSLIVYDSLDENNLLDYLTINQVSYSTSHSWTAYGFAFNYFDTRYESVSRYYFDNVVINDSKIVPVSYGIRPGEPMDPLPVGVTRYNEDDIYWVVVHDTASTAAGSGALAHANYLYNNAIAGNQLWVSWHYTIDDTFIYQSLPENERGYHAGDGSSQPLQPVTYLGGGNRNGIGIEMAVNQDGDMYRTWQRTAKLVVDILTRNNLPLENQTYHNDFSGKDCPNTLRNAGLIPLFELFLDAEYKIKTEHPDASIIFESHNPEFLDNHGRIIAMPGEAMTVSYTITVIENGISESRTFYTYLPGTIH